MLKALLTSSAAVGLLALAAPAALADHPSCNARKPVLAAAGADGAKLRALRQQIAGSGLCPDMVAEIDQRIADIPPPSSPPPPPDPCASAKSEWPDIRDSSSLSVLRNWRERNKACTTYRDLADARIQAVTDAQKSPSPPPPPPPAAPRPSPTSPDLLAFRAAEADGSIEQRTFRDRLKDGSSGPEMVALPTGSFQMGSPAGEAGRGDDEGPQRRVTISTQVAVMKHEVTLAEFRRFVQATGRTMGGDCYADFDGNGSWEQTAEANWTNPGFTQSGGHPVVCVSWEDARAYARWLSGETGESYRLLSEAEWEYAARAGTTSAYNFGSDANAGCGHMNGPDTTAKAKYANWRTLTCNDGYLNTAPVGSFAANRFGLHDMHGNVWEWVEDCYEDSYSAGQPDDGSAFTKSSCSYRVLRGGGWNSDPAGLRSADRDWNAPSGRFYILGFRVTRTL